MCCKAEKSSGEVLSAMGLLSVPTSAMLPSLDPYHVQTNSNVNISQSFKEIVSKWRETHMG